MRKVLLLAVTVVTAVLAADQRCLQKADTDSRNLVHDTDCRKFYACNDDDQVAEHECAEGLEFNPLRLTCDKPQGFCDKAMVSTADEYLGIVKESLMAKARSLPAHIDCSSPQGGWFDDKTDCTRFYVCIMGNALRQQCHAGQFYDASRKMCRTGTCANKGGAGNTVAVNTMSSGINLSSSCTEGSAMSTGSNTDVYYKCLGGSFREIRCDAGKVFSSTTKSCVASVMASKPATLDASGECTPNTKYPNLFDKTSYYECQSNKVLKLIKCANNGNFNATTGNCDTLPTAPLKCTTGEIVPNYFNNATYYVCQNNVLVMVSCEAGSFFNPTSKNCTSGGSGSEDCTNGEIYADTADKTKFYVCYDGKLRSQSCPDRMKFHPIKKYCELSNSPCGSTPHGGFQQALGQPDKFYVCVDGDLILELCPEGQMFSPALGYCSVYRPDSTVRPTPVPTAAPSLDCGQILQGQFVPDPADETRYFICVLGTLWPQQCDENMVFNANVSLCVNLPATSAPGSCGVFSSGQRLPICDSDYNEYYLVCAMGVFIVQKCPDTYVYNPTTTYCEVDSKPTGGCGLYADGAVWASDDSAGNTYMQCINGSPAGRTCPAGLIFSNQANYCMNPCSAGNGNENVMDPNNNSSYYECIKNEVQGYTPTPCADGQSFFQSLAGIGVHTGFAEGCIDSEIVDVCPPNAFANVPVYPLDTVTGTTSCQIPGPTSTPMTNFYVECYQGTGSLQKCPEGYIIYNGACMNLSIQCTAGEVSCIC